MKKAKRKIKTMVKKTPAPVKGKLESLKNNQDKASTKKVGHGGARPGAGRRKGTLSEENQFRLEALRRFKDRVAKQVDPLFEAQLNLARGASYLIRTEEIEDNSGKRREVHVIVEDPEEITEALDGGLGQMGDRYYRITTKSPDNKAIDSLLNRAFGSPTQNVSLDAEITNKPIDLSSLNEKELRQLESIASKSIRPEAN